VGINVRDVALLLHAVWTVNVITAAFCHVAMIVLNELAIYEHIRHTINLTHIIAHTTNVTVRVHDTDFTNFFDPGQRD
jgi:hypothetical protein